MRTTFISSTVADLVHEHVIRYGALDVETGLFLLAPRGSDTVTSVAFAGTHGVERHRGRFALSGRAVSKLLRYLGEQDLISAAQVHSHRGRAGLSRTDLNYGFSVEGFTSAVIPYYRRPPLDPKDWGWWRYHDGHWQTIGPFSLDTNASEVSAVIFDEGGVHAA
jgi:hypothetical protein